MFIIMPNAFWKSFLHKIISRILRTIKLNQTSTKVNVANSYQSFSRICSIMQKKNDINQDKRTKCHKIIAYVSVFSYLLRLRICLTSYWIKFFLIISECRKFQILINSSSNRVIWVCYVEVIWYQLLVLWDDTCLVNTNF